MRRILIRLVAGCVAIPLCFVLASLSSSEVVQTVFVILALFLGLPFLIVTAVDLMVELKADPRRGLVRRLAIAALSVPVGLLGLTSVLFGAVILLWLAYNLFVERQPQFGHWSPLQPLGIAPALIAFGVLCLRRALATRLEEPVAFETDDFDPELEL